MRDDSAVTAGAGQSPKGGIAALWREAQALGGMLLCAGCALAAYVIRYRFVEPEAMGAACEQSELWWCPLRTGFIMVTEWGGFGWLAFALTALAVAALVARRTRATRRLAVSALIVGGFGMVLYNATLSVAAVVVAGLCLIRAR